ncbi:predicted protein [Naegleria gruberi]|uniref:Predicted protein n=1 Tax=Naegleria gruberi TaxID=5762 RepID=D2VVC9_NAEGR|nr:uncharacterized protein NAEGRDRAFT_72971 [Naegleria gruberi]EFC39213.1 predicted protein [Naegleria gruberi]|eukprot:XP_002671957.1 predicted protein [Naegleria gruberi strain NEG-M]
MLGKRSNNSSTCCASKKTKYDSCCSSSSCYSPFNVEWDGVERSELANVLHQIGSNPHQYSYGKRNSEKEGLLGFPGLKIHFDHDVSINVGLPLCSEQLESIRNNLNSNLQLISSNSSSSTLSEKMICLNDEDLFSIENPYWMEQLEEILKDVLSQLQVENHISGLIRKNSLIIASEGCSDIPITSTRENCFVKLVVRLPSNCEGGHVVVNSGKISYNFSKGSCYSSTLTACYSNIDATIKGITKGCAMYLVFDICHQDGCETPTFINSKELFSKFMDNWEKSPYFVIEYKQNSDYYKSITSILNWYVHEMPIGSLEFEFGTLNNDVLYFRRINADLDINSQSLLFSKGDRENIECIIIISKHFTTEVYLHLGMEIALDYLKRVFNGATSQHIINFLKKIIDKYSKQLDGKKIVDYIIELNDLELAKLLLREILCHNFNHEVLFKLVQAFTLKELRTEVIKVLSVCFIDHLDGCVDVLEALNCPTVSASVLPQCSLSEQTCTCSQLEKVLDLASKFDIVIQQIPENISKLSGNPDDMYRLSKKIKNKSCIKETLQRSWKSKTLNPKMIVECVGTIGLTESRDLMRDGVDSFCSSHKNVEILETIGSFSEILNSSNDASCNLVMSMLARNLISRTNFTIRFVHHLVIPFLKQLTNKEALSKSATQSIAKHCLKLYNNQNKVAIEHLQPLNSKISHIILSCSCETCAPVQEFIESNERIYTIPFATKVNVDHLVEKVSGFYSDILLSQSSNGNAIIEKVLLKQTKIEIKENIAFLNSLHDLTLLEDDVE